MIKPKLIFSVSILSMFVSLAANADIASSGYVDQQVDTRLSSISGTTTGDGNVVTEISASGDTITATKGINAEVISNKVTAVGTTDTANDTKYPSELAVAKALDEKQDKLEGEVLTNTATGTSSFSTGEATPATSTASVAIGDGSTVSGDKAVAVGVSAGATSLGALAIGYNSSANAQDSIQLGNGENNEASTFQVGSYKVLDADGKIPAERMPDTILTNTATGTNSFSTGDATPVASDASVAIGNGSAVSGDGKSIALGYRTNVTGMMGTALGAQATVEGDGGIAIGLAAGSSAENSIQIGTGENSEANTMSVGLSNNNYKLLNSDGTIPAERMPDTVLTNTATGTAALAVEDTVNASGDYSISLGNKSSASGSEAVVLGHMANGSALAAIAIGSGAAASDNAMAIGYNSSSPGYLSVSVGYGAETDVASDGGIAVGSGSSALNQYSTALGYKAISDGEYAIQIGQGANSEANTLSVGLSESNNYKLLGSDGKIPADRIPDDVLKNTNPSGFAIGGATGGYNGFAIGSGANGGGYGVAVGPSSSADNYSVSIGRGAVSSNSGIQIGQGTNSEANTFQVNSYKMLGSDGKIPVERLPAARIPVGSSSSPTSYATFWIE